MDSKFVKRKKSNNKRAIILIVILLIVIFIFFNLESFLEKFFTNFFEIKD